MTWGTDNTEGLPRPRWQAVTAGAPCPAAEPQHEVSRAGIHLYTLKTKPNQQGKPGPQAGSDGLERAMSIHVCQHLFYYVTVPMTGDKKRKILAKGSFTP